MKTEVKLEGVGTCIYCGDSKGPLSDEHIVPYSLGGSWILGNASCKRCATITSKFERSVARETMMVARATMGIQTRRLKNRPTEFSVTVNYPHNPRVVKVETPELTGTVVFQIFAPLSKPVNDKAAGNVEILDFIELHVGGPTLKEMAKSLSVDAIRMKYTIQGHDFERMIAKIALGFAVAEYGVDAMDSFITPAILGERDDVGRWVGSPRDWIGAATEELHEVVVSDNGNEVVARVRLLASHGGPWYEVLVGALK